ncbi:MAG: hypothetical protein AMXMBFR13_51300 [Phycisphaerae bacterium]
MKKYPQSALSCLLAGLIVVLPSAVRADETGVEAVPPYGPVVDESADLLKVPAGLSGRDGFVVAKQPPRITFSTFTGLPTLRDTKKKGGLWSLWGEGVRAANGKFYVGVGNHRGRDANCYLYEYDPATHAHRQVVDVARLIGQKDGEWGQGKLHGRLDEMPDGWIYFATYWGEHPDRLPLDEQLKIGGRLVRYNTRTGETEDLGAPYPGESWPMHATDTARGIFHAIGLWGGYLAYDVFTGKKIFCGQLPGDITWDGRDTLIDEKTGFCYGSEMHTRRLVGFDPARAAFFHTKASVPRHPVAGKESRPWIRSYTRRRLRDGSFICQTYDGVMFKFFPDEERTELMGTNWGDGLYATSMALSPDDHYLYYTVGAHGSTWNAGSPIIQLDLRTNAKKVLAFLHPYYQEKHGYVFGGSYSVCADSKATGLLITWNGRFRKSDETGESFGHLSFMHLAIPAAERTDPPAGQARTVAK